MSTNNIGFYDEMTKITCMFQLSSNTHLISSIKCYISKVFRQIWLGKQCIPRLDSSQSDQNLFNPVLEKLQQFLKCIKILENSNYSCHTI